MDFLDFTILENNKPNVTARFNLPPFMRIYVHGDWKGSSYEARDHVLETFDNLKLIEKSDFFVVIPWKESKDRDKIIDFFGYNWEQPWPKNSECPRSIYTRNGEIFDGSACGDGRIICGAEEFYRRLTENKDEYLNDPPRIKGLGLRVDE